MSNSAKYPEAWNIFIEHARNISEDKKGKEFGNYSIHHPFILVMVTKRDGPYESQGYSRQNIRK